MIGVIFKLTLCVRLLLVYKPFTIFFRINAFINVYYNFSDVYHIYASRSTWWRYLAAIVLSVCPSVTRVDQSKTV